MAVTYESISSFSNTNANGSLPITKPTGLVVGDRMIAGIVASRDGASISDIAAPTGWEIIDTIYHNTDNKGAYFTKIADADDVAATNFTFTSLGINNADDMIGSILRISDAPIIVNTAKGTGTGESLSFSGFTPERPNCLLVLFVQIFDTSSSPSASAYAIANDNPTWTERGDTNLNNDTDSGLAVATALRPEQTETGNVSASFDGFDVNHWGALLIAIAPQVNGSVVDVAETLYVVNQPLVFEEYLTINDPDVATVSVDLPDWSNTNKPITPNYTNTPK